MSRVMACTSTHAVGFPRVSGDEPPPIAVRVSERPFSPRERG